MTGDGCIELEIRIVKMLTLIQMSLSFSLSRSLAGSLARSLFPVSLQSPLNFDIYLYIYLYIAPARQEPKLNQRANIKSNCFQPID